MTTAEDVKAFLQSLGTTHEEVAEKLRAAGVKGYRISAGNCPVARLVKRQFPDLFDFSISRTGFTIHEPNPEEGCWSIRTPLDEYSAVGRFIAAFDTMLTSNYADLAETEV